jgi:hypothetical protein
LFERGQHAERDPEAEGPQEGERAELHRARGLLAQDLVHGHVPERERGPEVEHRDALEVVPVLLVPGQVEAVPAVEVLADRLRLRVAVLRPLPLLRVREPQERPVPEGVAADRAHHEEDRRDDDQEDRQRPEHAPEDERGHATTVPEAMTSSCPPQRGRRHEAC